MTQLSKDYADELAKLAPHRRQTWRNVLAILVIAACALLVAGVVVGVGGAIAWIVGSAIVRALT